MVKNDEIGDEIMTISSVIEVHSDVWAMTLLLWIAYASSSAVWIGWIDLASSMTLSMAVIVASSSVAYAHPTYTNDDDLEAKGHQFGSADITPCHLSMRRRSIYKCGKHTH